MAILRTMLAAVALSMVTFTIPAKAQSQQPGVGGAPAIGGSLPDLLSAASREWASPLDREIALKEYERERGPQIEIIQGANGSIIEINKYTGEVVSIIPPMLK
jgi:hypothetical protein